MNGVLTSCCKYLENDKSSNGYCQLLSGSKWIGHMENQR